MRRIKVGLSESTIARIDSVRGDVPRERWIRRLVEARAWNGGHVTPTLTPKGDTRGQSEPVTIKDSVADVVAFLPAGGDMPLSAQELAAQVPGLVPASSLKTPPDPTDEGEEETRPW